MYIPELIILYLKGPLENSLIKIIRSYFGRFYFEFRYWQLIIVYYRLCGIHFYELQVGVGRFLLILVVYLVLWLRVFTAIALNRVHNWQVMQIKEQSLIDDHVSRFRVIVKILSHKQFATWLLWEYFMTSNVVKISHRANLTNEQFHWVIKP